MYIAQKSVCPFNLYSHIIHIHVQTLLKQEIEQLKYLTEHHPDGSRLAKENVDLKAALKKLRASLGKEVSSRQLEHSHRYTLQLEKQLRCYLARGNISESVGAWLGESMGGLRYYLARGHYQ